MLEKSKITSDTLKRMAGWREKQCNLLKKLWQNFKKSKYHLWDSRQSLSIRDYQFSPLHNGYLKYQAYAHSTQYQLLADAVVLTGPCTHVA